MNNLKNGCQTCKRIKDNLYISNFKKTIPEPNEIIKLDINMKKINANRMIFYYGSKGPYHKKYASEKNAYGEYCNRGIGKLDQNGKLTIYLEAPGIYKVNSKYYQNHIHFILSNKQNTKWLDKEYTIDVNKNQIFRIK